jgi:predicted metal-binding protein
MTVTLKRRGQHAHILVCRSCGDTCVTTNSANDASSGEHPTKKLRIALENALLNGQSTKWQVRVIESSCLDICPVGEISVRLVGAESSESKVLTWTVSPQTDVEELLETLKKYLPRLA